MRANHYDKLPKSDEWIQYKRFLMCKTQASLDGPEYLLHTHDFELVTALRKTDGVRERGDYAIAEGLGERRVMWPLRYVAWDFVVTSVTSKTVLALDDVEGAPEFVIENIAEKGS